MNLNLDAGQILAGVVFGLVGFVAFNYGRKAENWRVMGLGAALIAYPYLMPQSAPAIATWGVGAALTAALFVFRD